jgi:hypothetical protein
MHPSPPATLQNVKTGNTFKRQRDYGQSIWQNLLM